MSDAVHGTRFWNRMARKYASNKIADPAAYERTLERTRSYLKSSDAVLELGCGTGTTALNLASAVTRYVASDLSPEMVAIGREKAKAQGVQFVVASADAAPCGNASYNAVLAFNLLHLVRDRGALLRNVHRVLKPGGLFISKTPCISDANPLLRIVVPVMQRFGSAPYVAFFTATELECEITNAGFEIVENARHGSGRKDARPYLVARRS